MKRVASAGLLLAAGCGSSSATSVASNSPTEVAALEASAEPSAKRSAAAKGCPATEPTFTPTGQYRHKRTRLLVQSQGSPRHFASDAAVAVGASAKVRGKFTYGEAGKDLEDEEISLFVRDESCTWRSIGTAFTDDDGWVTLEIPESFLSKPGVHAYQLVVRGDGSRASGSVLAVEKGTRAVVFDVDATLTTSDEEIAREILEDKVPEARPNGNEVARAYAEQGLVVIYLTGRPYMLGPSTRTWLEGHGFPAGLIRTTDSIEDSAPTEAAVGAYKIKALAELKASGLQIIVAYGNAQTDICAYAAAGIDPRKTFILGPYAGQGCNGKGTTEALAAYLDHVGKVADFCK